MICSLLSCKLLIDIESPPIEIIFRCWRFNFYAIEDWWSVHQWFLRFLFEWKMIWIDLNECIDQTSLSFLSFQRDRRKATNIFSCLSEESLSTTNSDWQRGSSLYWSLIGFVLITKHSSLHCDHIGSIQRYIRNYIVTFQSNEIDRCSESDHVADQ